MRPREAMTAAAHIQEMWRSSCESVGEGFAVSTSTVALPMRAVCAEEFENFSQPDLLSRAEALVPLMAEARSRVGAANRSRLIVTEYD